MDNDYLQHYGVLGMKWGVRRSQKQLARSKKKVDKLKARKKEIDKYNRLKKKLSDTKIKESELKEYIKKGKNKTLDKTQSGKEPVKKVSIKDLSDADLKARITRLENENRYKELIKNDLASKHKAQNKLKDYVGKLLDKSMDSIVIDNVVDVGKQTVKQMMVDKVNQEFNRTKRVKNEEKSKLAGQDVWEDILEELVFTNNKKK